MGNFENTAGAIMTPEFLRLCAGMTAGEGLRAVRASGLDSEAMYTIYVTDPSEKLLGLLDLRTLLFADEAAPVERLMDENLHTVAVDDDQRLAAQLVRKYDLISLPVVDGEGALVGAIGVNSIVEIIEEENTEDFEKMAAMLPSEESYLSSSIWSLAWHRIPWLLILLISAIFAEKVIHGYSALLLTTGALGMLVTSSMPMMMDTGGNCGSQSSTTIIRSLALGELTIKGTWLALKKEFWTAVLCGVGLAISYWALLVLFFQAAPIAALVIAGALFWIVVLANVLGCLLPMFAHFVKLDPALMAGPLITTVVDICALLILFGMASLIA